MKRPMLRLHNPHLKNKVHGLDKLYHTFLTFHQFKIPPYNALGWSLMPTLTQELLRSVVVLQRYIWNVLSPMHLWYTIELSRLIPLQLSKICLKC
ncbi:hypothetical protein YC2023_005200 [Brassica napus]